MDRWAKSTGELEKDHIRKHRAEPGGGFSKPPGPWACCALQSQLLVPRALTVLADHTPPSLVPRYLGVHGAGQSS